MPKQELDVFSNPDLLPLLKRLNADSYVVYGVVTEICVEFAAFGLLKTGKSVTIVTDAIRGLDESAADSMIARFTEAGGHLVTSRQILT
jgi:nicotinamidase-related amidase